MNTHETSQPNKKEPLSMVEVKKLMGHDDYVSQISAYYKGNKEEAMRFITAAIQYVRRVPKLLECDKVSLFAAFMESAQFRFLPSGVSGEAYIIPYGSDAKFQLGYQGIVTLLYRADKVASINANIVHAKDQFEYEEGLEPKLIHKFNAFEDRGEAIGVYTVIGMTNGAKTFKVMSKADVMKIKDMSRAKNSKESPWNSKDPQLWMWKKTCLIQHAKLLPKTPELQVAIAKDYEGEGIEKPLFDADGVATAKVDHKSN